MLEKKPFTRYNEEKVRDSFTVNLNPEQRKDLEEAKTILNQEKDSTAIKQLAEIGTKEITSQKTRTILEIVIANKRKNKRLGINQYNI